MSEEITGSKAQVVLFISIIKLDSSMWETGEQRQRLVVKETCGGGGQVTVEGNNFCLEKEHYHLKISEEISELVN